jgi:glycosyltransferase involved in cell wall biosynthesis
MRVAIDVSAVHATSGGVLRYLKELAAHVPSHGIQPVLLDQKERASNPHRRLFEPSADVSVVGCAPTSRATRLVWEQVALPGVVRKLDAVSVLHSPHYTMPRKMPGPVRLHRRLPNVVTIHDLTFFTLPHLHEPAKRHLFRSAIRYAARHADALVCVSDRTASLLQELVDVTVPVFVAPHGIDTERFRPSTPETRTDDAPVLRKLGVEAPYVLWLGTVAPHKNLGNLLEGFDLLRRDSHDRGIDVRGIHLVVAGQSWPGAWEAVAPTPPAAVTRLGFVDEDDLVPLMRNARAFAYPSIEEGFGFPVLEALACGVPVLTSTDTTMADIAGGQAVLVDPHSVTAIRDGLAACLSMPEGDSDAAVRTRTARVARARTFTWAGSAATHAEAYRSALGKNP